jgi:hypothetical protein
VEDYRDEDHFWSHLGGFRAVKFDLRCAKCSQEVHLGDVMALIQCMTCDPECGVFQVAMGDLDLNNRVCVALCADTSHVSEKCIGEERLRALNQYFEYEFKDTGKRILVVPCIMRRSVDSCQGVSLAETGLAELRSKKPVPFLGE